MSVYNNEWRSPFIVAATVNEDVTHRCHVISSVVGLRELISCCRRWRRLPVECHDLLFACQSRTSSSMHWLTALPLCRSRLNFSHPFLSSRVLQVFQSRTDTDLVHIRRGVTDTTLDKNSSLLSQCLLATDCWNMCIYFSSSDDRWDVLCFTAELLLPVDLSSPRPSSGDPSQYISGRVLNIARKTSSSIIPTPSYVLQFFQKKNPKYGFGFRLQSLVTVEASGFEAKQHIWKRKHALGVPMTILCPPYDSFIGIKKFEFSIDFRFWGAEMSKHSMTGATSGGLKLQCIAIATYSSRVYFGLYVLICEFFAFFSKVWRFLNFESFQNTSKS